MDALRVLITDKLPEVRWEVSLAGKLRAISTKDGTICEIDMSTENETLLWMSPNLTPTISIDIYLAAVKDFPDIEFRGHVWRLDSGEHVYGMEADREYKYNLLLTFSKANDIVNLH